MKRGISSAAALALGAALLLGGCVQKGVDYVDVTEDIVDRFPFEAEPVELNPQQAEESNTYAVFHTTAGDITVMLYPEESPDEVSCFIEQAKAGAYDGQQFVYVRRDGLIESDNVVSDDAEAADSTSESDSATESTSVSESASFPSAAQSTPAEGISSSIGAPSSDERTSEESAYDTGVTAAWGEQLLMLSTCSDYTTGPGRLLVVGRLESRGSYEQGKA